MNFSEELLGFSGEYSVHQAGALGHRNEPELVLRKSIVIDRLSRSVGIHVGALNAVAYIHNSGLCRWPNEGECKPQAYVDHRFVERDI